MNKGIIAAALRAIAIVIAIVALIDPAWTRERTQATPPLLINLSQSDAASLERMFRDIGGDLIVRDGSTGRLPCAPGERCIVAADGSRDVLVPADLDQPIALVTMSDEGANIAIDAASTTATQHRAASGVVRVTVSGKGVAGRRGLVRVSDGGAVAGSSVMEWKADATQSVDVPWWPIAAGARVLRVEASLDGGDAVAYDNTVDLPVTITGAKVAVLVFDPRPSWSSTFVRRALEDDPRFIVDHRARVAPALTTGTAAGRLDAATLETTPLVIAGAPDALTAADVDLLDRYVRNRGGSLVLLPERAPSGAAARLFDGDWAEQLLAQPEGAGPLRASEVLRPRGLSVAASAISPLVIATPRGHGRIVVSGAMDAWRHRLAGDGFDRFWTSLAAEAASAGEQVRIEVGDRLPAAGERIAFTVRYRSMTPAAATTASAVATCDRAQPLRLWPTGAAGVLAGELPIASVPSCTIEAAVNGSVGQASIAISQHATRPVGAVLEELGRAARASGGVVTDEDNLEPIREWNRSSPPVNAASLVWPMHSALWLLPFAACLCGEWWLRRRQGLR